MSQWHLTKSKTKHDKLSSICSNSGLNTCNTETNEYLGYNISSYKKRAIDNINYVNIGDDWVYSAGTVISNGEVGRPALSDLYKYISEDGINSGRKNIIGHYAVAIKLGDTILCFTDPQGAFQLYYSTEQPWTVSTSLRLVGQCNDAWEPKPLKIIETAIHGQTGEETFISNVRRLYGGQLLRIELSDNSISKEKIPIEMSGFCDNYNSCQGYVSEYTKRVRNVFNELQSIDSIGLNTTGGIDTRTVLAALLDQNISPRLMYGVGNSALTNTRKKDLEISQDIAKHFNLEFYKMNWSGSQPHSSKMLRSQFTKYGFHYRRYGGSESFFKEFDGGMSPYPTLHLGGFSPAFTTKKPWGKENKKYSLNELVDDYISRIINTNMFADSVKLTEYREHIKNQIREALSYSPIDYQKHGNSLDTYVKAKLFLNIRNQAGFVTTFNQFSYYLSPFLMKELNDPLITIPFKYRENNEFQLRVIDDLFNDAFTIRIYSSHEEFNINQKTLNKEYSFINKIDKMESNFTQTVGEVLPAPTRSLAEKVYNTMRSDSGKNPSIDHKVRLENTKYILDHPMMENYFSTLSDIDLNRLNNMKRILFGIEQINNTDS